MLIFEALSLRCFMCACKEVFDVYRELVELLKGEREKLAAAEPTEFVISNVVLSVLKMIREESERATLGSDEFSPYDSLNVILSS